jgi:hypothetical protein
MEEGTGYTIVVDGDTANFTGIDKDTDDPEVDSVRGTDDNVVEVVFEDAFVDTASAEDVANYSIDKEGTVVKAELDDDRLTVKLTVEGLVTGTSKKMTVEGVKSVEGVEMSKTTKTFSPDYDTKAPKLDEVQASKFNNEEVIIDFDDEHGVDEATAEDVANYEIEGLEVLSAEAIDVDEDDYMDRVVLTTSAQSKSKKYELTVKYMVDGSTAANAITKELTEKFQGGDEDDSEPTLDTDTDFVNMTEVHVVFNEDNALDAATALDAGNYSFKDDELDVIDVAFDDEDENGNDYEDADPDDDSTEIIVVLTVSGVEVGERYKLQIDGVADVYGNVLEDEDKTIEVEDEVKVASPIASITTDGLETVIVEFDSFSDAAEMDEATAEDPTNYVFDGGVGAAKEAELDDDNLTVTLTVPEMTDGKVYELTVNGVENLWGFAAEDMTKKFVATDDSADDEQPEVDSVSFTEKGYLTVTFTESMDDNDVTDKELYVSTDSDATSGSAGLITVSAVKVMGDDNEDIVFDAAEDVLATDTEYYVVYFNGDVTDRAGNKVDYDESDEDFDTDDEAYDEDADSIQVDSIFQEDGRTVHVYFEESVLVADAAEIESAGDKAYDFTMELDDEDDTLVILTLDGNSFDDDEEEITFDFGTDGDITDLLGRDVRVETVEVDVENDDEEGPVLEELNVLDNRHIELVFDEPLSSAGTWDIDYEDEDGDDESISSVTVDDFEKGDSTVTLELGEDLDSDFDYDLSIDTEPRDLAGNKYEDADDTWTFAGVDVDPEEDFLGFEILNATKARVFLGDNDEFTTTDGLKIMVGSTDLFDAGEVEAEVGDSGDIIVTIEDVDGDYDFFDADETYQAMYNDQESQAAAGKLSLEDVDTATTAADAVVVTLDSYDFASSTSYEVTLYDAADYSVVATDADTEEDPETITVDDSEISLPIADLSIYNEDAYVIVVKDESGVVVVVTDSFDFDAAE